MAKIKPDTMELSDQREMFKSHPDWRANWLKWKNKTISAKDAGTPVDIIICGINSRACLIAKLKYAKNETNFPIGWMGDVLSDSDFVLANYIDIDAHYTFDFKLE